MFSPSRLLASLTTALLLLGTLAALAFAAWEGLGWYATQPGPNAAPASILFARGTTTRGFVQQLDEAGLIRSPLAFSALAWLEKRHHTLQAGEYAFPAQVRPLDILSAVAEGRVVKRLVTIPEGWTSAQAVAALNAAEAMQGTITTVPAEGTLLPDSYQYTRDDDRAALLAHMEQAMTREMARLWPARQAGLPYANEREALTLASIVERETALPAERPMVAAVYLNRLRLGMKLQADPTVAYGITQGKTLLERPLSRADLLTPTPYNTYTETGLPPGPICNPGRASLEAVFHPAETNALYFVANGQGGHAFAATLEEHNHNVAAWRALHATPAP